MNNLNKTLSRRDLITNCSHALCSLAIANMSLLSCKNPFHNQPTDKFVKLAKRWKPLSDNKVQCQLCPNECILYEGDRGICQARKNIDGKLYSLVYSRIAASHIDPVEKKPLYHFLPGSLAYSIATAGCNLHCKFCQNWQLSQSPPEKLEAQHITPGDLTTRAIDSKSKIIAYTYNEPTIQYEYIIDSSTIAREKGLRPVIISNGYIKKEAGIELAGNLDGIKIDLKAFTEKFYKSICGGSLKGVLENLQGVFSTGKWLEIVVLVIPTLNDSIKEIEKMTTWISKNLSQDVPVHFTRFHAMYQIRNLPPTPVKTLERCRTIAKANGIKYAYVGNVPGHKWENTYCHNCNRLIIKRSGFFHIENKIKDGNCPYCNTGIPGVWK